MGIGENTGENTGINTGTSGKPDAPGGGDYTPIVDENFESYPLGTEVWPGAGNPQSSAAVSDDVSFSGSKSYKFTIGTAFGESGRSYGATIGLGKELVNGEELWIRWRQYMPAGFQWTCPAGNGDCGTILKTVRVPIKSSGGSQYGYHDWYVFTDGNTAAQTDLKYLAQYEGLNQCGRHMDGVRRCGDPWFAQGIYFGPTGQGYDITRDTWHTMEMYFKFGVRDVGKHRMWQNGDLIFNGDYDRGQTWGTFNNASDRTQNYIYLFSYWNGGPPVEQSFYIDDVVISLEQPTQQDSNGFYYVGV